MSVAQAAAPGSPHSSHGSWDQLGSLLDDDPVVKPLDRPAIKATIDPGWKDAAKVAQLAQSLDGFVLHVPSKEDASPSDLIGRSILAEKALAQHQAARVQNLEADVSLVPDGDDGDQSDHQVGSEDEVSSSADPYDPQYSDQELADEELVGGASNGVANPWSGEGLPADPWDAIHTGSNAQ